MKIQKGDKIIIDKGICGTDKGVFVSVDGWSAFGYFGRYKSDKDGEEHLYDECVHKLSKIL